MGDARDVEAICARLEAIEAKLDALRLASAAGGERCRSHQTQTAEHHRTLYTNGLVAAVQRNSLRLGWLIAVNGAILLALLGQLAWRAFH